MKGWIWERAGLAGPAQAQGSCCSSPALPSTTAQPQIHGTTTAKANLSRGGAQAGLSCLDPFIPNWHMSQLKTIGGLRWLLQADIPQSLERDLCFKSSSLKSTGLVPLCQGDGQLWTRRCLSRTRTSSS